MSKGCYVINSLARKPADQRDVLVATRSTHHRHALVPCPSSAPAPAYDDLNTTHRNHAHKRDSDVSAASRQTVPRTWHSSINGTNAHRLLGLPHRLLPRHRSTIFLWYQYRRLYGTF